MHLVLLFVAYKYTVERLGFTTTKQTLIQKENAMETQISGKGQICQRRRLFQTIFKF